MNPQELTRRPEFIGEPIDNPTTTIPDQPEEMATEQENTQDDVPVPEESPAPATERRPSREARNQTSDHIGTLRITNKELDP